MESEIERLCKVILQRSSREQNDIRRNDEFWEQRNKAIVELTDIVAKVSKENVSYLNTNVMRLLKDPLKSLVLDQRSQQIRDTCIFLTTLAEKTGDSMKGLLREIFSTILEAMKQPNKVVRGYVDDCIISLIRNVTFKYCISGIVSEIRESKSKMVRENCLEYLNEIILHWELSGKDCNILDLLEEGIRLGLEEASVRGREIARLAYLNFRRISSKRAEKIKATQAVTLQMKLSKSEMQQEEKLGAKNTVYGDELFKGDTVQNSHIDSQSLSPSMPLRSPKPPIIEVAANQIQALVRGVVSRRKSLSISVNIAPETVISRRSDENLTIMIEEADENTTFKDLASFSNRLISNSGSKNSAVEDMNPRVDTKDGIKSAESKSKSAVGRYETIVKSSPPSNSDTNTDNNGVKEKTLKVSTLLKLKISRIMNLLHEQMEIAEAMENESFEMIELDGFIEELGGISSQEFSVASNFKNRILNMR